MTDTCIVEIAVPEIAAAAAEILELGVAIGRLAPERVEVIEAAETLGMGRKELVVSIAISFTTSFAASAGYDLLKAQIVRLSDAGERSTAVSIKRAAPPEEKGKSD